MGIYGTSKAAVKAVTSQNKTPILDIDVQGARSIRKFHDDYPARFIFIAPPSIESLEERLRGRGTESEEKIQIRLGNAKKELESISEPYLYDYVMVNGELEKAKREFISFVLRR